jgi:hypothetical protein
VRLICVIWGFAIATFALGQDVPSFHARGIEHRGTHRDQNPDGLRHVEAIAEDYRGTRLQRKGIQRSRASVCERNRESRGEKTSGYLLTSRTLYGRESVRGLDGPNGIYNLFDAEYADPGSSEDRQPRIGHGGRTFQVKFTYRF